MNDSLCPKVVTVHLDIRHINIIVEMNDLLSMSWRLLHFQYWLSDQCQYLYIMQDYRSMHVIILCILIIVHINTNIS